MKKINFSLLLVVSFIYLTSTSSPAAIKGVSPPLPAGVQQKVQESEQTEKTQKTKPTLRTPASKKPQAPSKPAIKRPGITRPTPKIPLGAKPFQKPAPARKSLSRGIQPGTTVTGVKTEKMQGDKQAKIIVTGQGLNKVTSAVLFLNNRPTPDVTAKRGLGSSASVIKFTIQARKGGLKNTGVARPGNYELRLRAGTKEIKVLTPIAKTTGISRPAPRKTAVRDTAPAPGKKSPLAARQKTTKPAATRSFRPQTSSEESGGTESTPEPSTPNIPDLVITNIAQNPPNPMQGQSWKFEVTILNQGTGAAFIPNGYEYMAHNAGGAFNGIQKGSNITLAPGQSMIGIQYPGNNQTGTNPVTFKVDPENVVNEADETNNQTTGSYTEVAAQGPPDLVITNVAVDPNPTTQGFQISVTVENQGTGVVDIQGTETTLISTIGTDNILKKGSLNLTPGQSRTFICDAVRLNPGTFNWAIKVDPNNRISESNDNNNTQNVSVTISGSPGTAADLIITNIAQNPPNPIQGQSWKFEVTILNQGTGTAFIPQGYEYMAHNAGGAFNGIQKGSNITLAPGQSMIGIQYPGNNQTGTNPVTFKVDPENIVTETDETNNQTTGSYTEVAAQGQPDLVISNVTVDPNPTIQGFQVSVTVENQGAGVVDIQGTETTLISTIGSDNILQKGSMNLMPGQSQIFNCYAVRLAAGTFNWTIKVDPGNRVSESDEANNSQNISVTIGDGT